MTLIEFMHEHWFLTWLLAWGVFGALYVVAEVALKVIGLALRTINIICRGWPPAHLDADGDWKPLPEKAQ